MTNVWFERIQVRCLLNNDSLSLLFGRGLWKRNRQDAVLHLGLHVLGLTRCVSIQRREETRS